MNRAILVGAIWLLILAASAAFGQDLSTEVFSSEDELLEAFIAGDIDYDEYILLLDIVQHGIDTTNLYLLDLVPNLSSLIDRESQSSLEAEQQALFVEHEGVKPSRIRYSYYRALDTKEQSRYRLDARARITESWQAEFGLRRELSGRERFVGRSLRYRKGGGLVREFTIGSVTERYGLGLVMGYRGKLLRYSGELDRESFLYPDNGSLNGVSISLQPHGWRLKGLTSHVRDTAFELSTLAVTGERVYGAMRPYFVVGGNRLRNRASGSRLDDAKIAGGITTSYSKGRATIEYCVQANAGRESGAFLAEGRHAFPGMRLAYAGWWYGRGYLDLTSGGRAASIQVKTELPEVDFTVSSRRPGQRGVQLKSKTELGPTTNLTSAVIAAGRNADSTSFQWLEGLEQGLTDRVSLRVDYLHSIGRRDNAEGEDERYTRRARVEARFSTDKLRIRTYLAFSSTSSYGDYVSLFASARLRISNAVWGEIWSNTSRIAHNQIDYWYLYAKLNQHLVENCSLAVKLLHRYNGRASVHHSSAVSLEVEAAW